MLNESAAASEHSLAPVATGLSCASGATFTSQYKRLLCAFSPAPQACTPGLLCCPIASSPASPCDSAGLSHLELSVINPHTSLSSPAICSPPFWHLQSFAPHPHAIWFQVSWKAPARQCFPALTIGAPCSGRRKMWLWVMGMLMLCLCFSLHCQVNASTANTSLYLQHPKGGCTAWVTKQGLPSF